MNNYQKLTLEFNKLDLHNMIYLTSKKTNLTKIISFDDELIIDGDRDINSTDYLLQIETGKNFEVQYLLSGKWENVDACSFTVDKNVNNNNTSKKKVSVVGAKIEFSLSNKPQKLKLINRLGIIDDIIVDIKYNLITKDEWDKEQNSPAMLRKKMNITFRTTENLVNIYWQHCKENAVKSVRIDLYVVNNNAKQLICKFIEGCDVFYKSIPNLAHGRYCFKLYQLDDENSEIAASDYMYFDIEKPDNNVYRSKGFVRL